MDVFTQDCRMSDEKNYDFILWVLGGIMKKG